MWKLRLIEVKCLAQSHRVTSGAVIQTTEFQILCIHPLYNYNLLIFCFASINGKRFVRGRLKTQEVWLEIIHGTFRPCLKASLASKVRRRLPGPRIAQSFFTNSGCSVLRLPYSIDKNSCPSSPLHWERSHEKACIESMGVPLCPSIINSACNQPKSENLFRLFSLSTDSQLPVFILSSFVPLIHFSCTSQSSAQRENSVCAEGLPDWNILTFQNNKLSLRCFRKACSKRRVHCYKRVNSFHIDLNRKKSNVCSSHAYHVPVQTARYFSYSPLLPWPCVCYDWTALNDCCLGGGVGGVSA